MTPAGAGAGELEGAGPVPGGGTVPVLRVCRLLLELRRWRVVMLSVSRLQQGAFLVYGLAAAALHDHQKHHRRTTHPRSISLRAPRWGSSRSVYVQL